MNFAALWARNSGRATPSLRCTPKAPTKETRQEATYLQREAVQTTGASSHSQDQAVVDMLSAAVQQVKAAAHQGMGNAVDLSV